MYEIGSLVIYRSEGVCVVSDIREESFGTIGEKEKYYILMPVNDEKSTLFVPLNNEKLCSMIRVLLSADEIMSLCDELRDTRFEWIEDNRSRNTYFKDLLSVGDRRDVIVIVNTICDRIKQMNNSGKKVTGTDENTLYRAVKMLYDEFKVTTDISSEADIIPLLCGELKLAEK